MPRIHLVVLVIAKGVGTSRTDKMEESVCFDPMAGLDHVPDRRSHKEKQGYGNTTHWTQNRRGVTL